MNKIAPGIAEPGVWAGGRAWAQGPRVAAHGANVGRLTYGEVDELESKVGYELPIYAAHWIIY